MAGVEMFTVEDFLRESAETFERAASVLRETGGEAHEQGHENAAAHALGVAEGLTIAAVAMRGASDPANGLRLVSDERRT